MSVVGSMLTACAGAIAVLRGLPVVPKPPLAVTLIPSLTMAWTDDGRLAEIVTVKFSARLPPAGTVLLFQTTLPDLTLPPWPAETNVVLAGKGSDTVTPDAAALPMFLTVTV